MRPSSSGSNPRPLGEDVGPESLSRVLVLGLGIDFGQIPNGLDDYRKTYRLFVDAFQIGHCPVSCSDFYDRVRFLVEAQPYRVGHGALLMLQRLFDGQLRSDLVTFVRELAGRVRSNLDDGELS